MNWTIFLCAICWCICGYWAYKIAFDEFQKIWDELPQYKEILANEHKIHAITFAIFGPIGLAAVFSASIWHKQLK